MILGNRDDGKFLPLYRDMEYCLPKAPVLGDNDFFFKFYFLKSSFISVWSVEDKFWSLKCLLVNYIHRVYVWEDHCSELALENLNPSFLLFPRLWSWRLKMRQSGMMFSDKFEKSDLPLLSHCCGVPAPLSSAHIRGFSPSVHSIKENQCRQME